MATHEAITTVRLRTGFALGEWRIWPNAGQIEQAGRKRHIEPKLVEVLLLLAANPGQVVTREALLEQAWPRQVVCDEALTRTISELRTLLGDNSRERRYIRTVPKRGYCLIADVNPLGEVAAVRSQPTVVADNVRAAGVISMFWAQQMLRYWLYGTGSLATAFGAVLVMVMVLADDVKIDVMRDQEMANLLASAGAMLSEITVVDTPVPSSINRLAVLPFSNITPDQPLNVFTQGLEEDIRTELASLHGVQVAGRLVSNRVQTSGDIVAHTNLQSIAEQLDVDAIVDGTVRLIDGDIRVTVEILDVQTGFPLWSKRYDRVYDEVLNLQTFIANDLVGELQQRLPGHKLVVAAQPKQQRSKQENLSLPGEEYGHTRHKELLAR